MIKVLEVEASKGWGGQEKRTVRLANHMPSDKVRTYFAVNPDSRLMRDADELRIECLPVKTRATYDLPAVLTLAKYIKELDIDIVSTHSGRDAWLGGMAAKLAGVKCVRVRHLQTPFASPFSYKYLTDEVTAISVGVREYIASRGVDMGKIRLIYTGIDTEHFQKSESTFRQEFGIGKETFLIGIVAILRGAKRHKDLIDAVKKLSTKYDVKLVIAGEGPQWENLQNKIKETGIADKVIMTGFRNDTVNILSALDLFVLPSNMEALGTALLEAQSCGVPVIGSRVGGIPEALEENGSGLLFECENVDDLVQKIEKFITDKEFHAKASKRAREFVVEKFSVEKMVSDTLKQYEEMLTK
ncbi:MAG: glycosyltransferase [Campylobacterales bacterium]|nr:glycosyltransferase [Campylobacterales bacterium]